MRAQPREAEEEFLPLLSRGAQCGLSLDCNHSPPGLDAPPPSPMLKSRLLFDAKGVMTRIQDALSSTAKDVSGTSVETLKCIRHVCKSKISLKTCTAHRVARKSLACKFL